MGNCGISCSEQHQRVRDILRFLFKGLMILAGTFFVIIGMAGIFLPVLPTTPFLLLAAACYAVSSKRFYDWLLNNRLFGSYIRNYREGRGITLKAKMFTITLLLVTMVISAFIMMEYQWLIAVFIIIAASVSIHILKIPTLKN